MKKRTKDTNDQLQLSLDLQKQRDYVTLLAEKKFEYGLVLANAFVKGMRDIGYKSTAFALDELIDNAIQAGARNIHAASGYTTKGAEKKPDILAIIDDGHGMDPLMVRASVIWGGTHRHNDRTGFGRYGYGLPSACVSIGRRYSVISKVEGGDWHQVSVDLDAIEEHFNKGQGPVQAPEPQKAALPDWIQNYINKHLQGSKAGTVVLIEKIDRLDYTSTRGLTDFLLQEFGVTYRNFINEITIAVNGTEAEPTDPLFLTPGFRYYDLDEDRATAVPPLEIEVKDKETKQPLGVIKARFSLLPPTFLRVPEDKFKPKGGKNNARFKIRKENNGIIVLRAGRQIDVINARNPWMTFQNNDRYVGIEIDFPPTLDEELSLTTLKQSVTPRPRIWDILEEHGIFAAIQELRHKHYVASVAASAKLTGGNKKRPSELAVENAVKLFTYAPTEMDSMQRRECELKLETAAEQIAVQLDLPLEQAKSILVERAKKYPFKVEFEEAPGTPFFRMEQVGEQARLYINKSHRFFRSLYAAPRTTSESQQALEALLFSHGLIEQRAKRDLTRVLAGVRAQWSKNADMILEEMHDDDVAHDQLSSFREVNDEREEQRESKGLPVLTETAAAR